MTANRPNIMNLSLSESLLDKQCFKNKTKILDKSFTFP